MQNKGALIFWGVVIVIGIGVGTFFGVRAIIRSNAVAPFNKQINTYLGGGMPPMNPNEPNKKTGKIKGKVIPVDVTKKEVDYVYFDLPDDLRPTKTEDVGAVALLQWGQVKTLDFPDGKSGYKHTVMVTVVDKDSRAVLGQTALVGTDPPSTKKRNSPDVYGSKPTEQIVNFVVNLAR